MAAAVRIGETIEAGKYRFMNSLIFALGYIHDFLINVVYNYIYVLI